MSHPSGLTPLSARYHRRRRPRAEIDRDAKRYLIYFLRDAAGDVVYIGRSCDVKGRIRAHYSDATHTYSADLRDRKAWLFDVRSLSVIGPFTWDEAVARERAEIERHQPRGNVMHTKAAGYYPLAEGGGQSVGRQPIRDEAAS